MEFPSKMLLKFKQLGIPESSNFKVFSWPQVQKYTANCCSNPHACVGIGIQGKRPFPVKENGWASWVQVCLNTPIFFAPAPKPVASWWTLALCHLPAARRIICAASAERNAFFAQSSQPPQSLNPEAEIGVKFSEIFNPKVQDFEQNHSQVFWKLCRLTSSEFHISQR